MAEQTPTARALSSRLTEILRSNIERNTGFIDAGIQARLKALRPRDIDAIRPPSLSEANGVWVNDTAFCRRLGAVLFDVSDETIDELSIRDYQVLLAAVYANFTSYLEAGAP